MDCTYIIRRDRALCVASGLCQPCGMFLPFFFLFLSFRRSQESIRFERHFAADHRLEYLVVTRDTKMCPLTFHVNRWSIYPTSSMQNVSGRYNEHSRLYNWKHNRHLFDNKLYLSTNTQGIFFNDKLLSRKLRTGISFRSTNYSWLRSDKCLNVGRKSASCWREEKEIDTKRDVWINGYLRWTWYIVLVVSLSLSFSNRSIDSKSSRSNDNRFENPDYRRASIQNVE